MTDNSLQSNPLAPVPFMKIGQIASDLDGQRGKNRAYGNQLQIEANNDVEAITAWLARFTDSPNTFNNYRREAERLLLWATGVAKKPVSSLSHEDLLVYQHFLINPQPANSWIMSPGRKLPRTHADWRPFAGPLAPTSQRQAIIILNSMFSWLVAAGYLVGNPLSLSRRKSQNAKPRITRYLDDELWMQVKLTILSLPRETNREREHYFRLRWLFSLMYLCGLRISEVTQNTMGAFFCLRDKFGEERWWLELVGKGKKIRLVPATQELMIELSHYRLAKGMFSTPIPYETTPLISPIGHQQHGLSRSAVHVIIKYVFKKTAARLREKGPKSEKLALQIEQASAHWLRHTAGSHMANNQIDLRNIRDNLGHESISTTNIYLHTSDDARHNETEKHHKLRWEV
ncbi:tyrosine-type recombinase/integrase [Advenella kashmirensis]